MCALHKQKLHTNRKLYKNIKNTNILLQSQKLVCKFIPEGVSPLWAGLEPEPLVRGKLVYREVLSEGSPTTKVGTDEQELNMRRI